MTVTLSNAVGIIIAAFTFWMLIHAIARQDEPADRVSWALLILLVPIVGAPIYFVREYLPQRKSVASKEPKSR